RTKRTADPLMFPLPWSRRLAAWRRAHINRRRRLTMSATQMVEQLAETESSRSTVALIGALSAAQTLHKLLVPDLDPELLEQHIRRLLDDALPSLLDAASFFYDENDHRGSDSLRSAVLGLAEDIYKLPDTIRERDATEIMVWLGSVARNMLEAS